MEALSRSFRALGDANRLRLLRLLARASLNVSELVSLVGIAQPSVSHHLAKLRALGLIREERQAGFTYYSLAVEKDDAFWPLIKVALEAGGEADGDGDLSRLADLLRRREDRQALNDRLLEPGQSFQLWSRALGSLLPRIDVADLGCGSGALTVEIARWAKSVLAIDRSEVALRSARERISREGLGNVELLAADLVDGASKTIARRRFDLAVASQSLHFAEDPARFVRAAHRLIKPRGRLLVLELLPHSEEWVRERLGHRWLGFEPQPLAALLEREGMQNISTEIPAQSASSPFRVFLLTGEKR
jgi:ArsR family transcriptional regulator